MDRLELKLCSLQGRLFENSGPKGYASEPFIRIFMQSELAKYLDCSYNSMQWMGEEYWMEVMQDNELPAGGEIYPPEVLYWIGYLYRYWHLSTGEASRKIVRTAPPQTMHRNYLIFHTMDPDLAIEDLLEICRQKHSKAKIR